jgi:phosphoribosyl 1,2-cyclic phosphodiesterase
MAAPLRASEVAEKLVLAIQQLVEQGRLDDLRPGPDLQQAIRRRVVEELPFHLQSTFGGNTTCVEVQTPDALLILDGGSGLRELGIALSQRWDSPSYSGPRSAHVLITHPHFDHICGIPFADPFYDSRNHFTFWGARSVLDSLAAILRTGEPLSGVFFPPTYDQMKGLKDFREMTPGSEFHIGSTRIRTYGLNHPGGCVALRLENAGRVFAFVTDHEHPQVPDPGLAAFVNSADLLYMDGQYLQAEYDGLMTLPNDMRLGRHGWGHSSVEACVATAVLAQVRQLHVGHREPKRSDRLCAQLEKYLQEILVKKLQGTGRPADACRALIPFEGMTVQF